MLPLALEQLPVAEAVFDTVFSLGGIYHRRSPIDHLLDLRRHLRPGGQLVIESLVLEGVADSCLIPEDRYARMRNVWFIPSVESLETDRAHISALARDLMVRIDGFTAAADTYVDSLNP